MFAQRSKLAAMFKYCISRAAIDALIASGRVALDDSLVVAGPGP